MQERGKVKQPDQNWPFDPMQPGDHEPVRLPEETDVEETPQGLDSPGSGPKALPKR